MGDRIRIADVEAQVGVLERLAPAPFNFRTVRALLRLARAAQDYRAKLAATGAAIREGRGAEGLIAGEQAGHALDDALAAFDFEP